MLPNSNFVKDPKNLQIFLLADVIFVILLLSITIRQVLLIFIYKRKSSDESRLYTKFVNLFTAMALGPAIGLVIITSLFFNDFFKSSNDSINFFIIFLSISIF